MKKSNSPWIAQLHFDNAKTSIWASAIANLILFICYLFGLTTEVFKDSHAVFCMVSATVLIGLCLRYSWKNSELNLLILSLYLISVGFEFIFLGLASNPLGYSEYLGISKGIVFEMAVSLLPSLYFVIRIFAAVPLILIYIKAKKLEKVIG